MNLLERRQSYERIPRFFFPKPETDWNITQTATKLCKQRVMARINVMVLTKFELNHLLNRISSLAYAPKLSLFQRSIIQKTVKISNISLINRLLSDGMVLELSYDEYKSILQSSKSECVQKVLSPQVFLMLPPNSNGCINGYTLLEYVLQYQRVMVATKFLCEQNMLLIDGTMEEKDVLEMLAHMIQSATQAHVHIDPDFYEYYELICTRMLLLRHLEPRTGGLTTGVIAIDNLLTCHHFLDFFHLMDKDLHVHYFVAENDNCFHPESIRWIHRQYLQLDRDQNGMISIQEMMDYGKKKAFNPKFSTPTHDLTREFINHVFMESKTYSSSNGTTEMDYKSYIDFTLLMADKTSHSSLRFFWNVLDFQKQGYLDAYALDYFLRGLVDKILEHDIDSPVTVTRLRTQVFDLVAPEDPSRITWKDLAQCQLGHLVVRMLTDYVAYRAYEECDGRFPVSISS